MQSSGLQAVFVRDTEMVPKMVPVLISVGHYCHSIDLIILFSIRYFRLALCRLGRANTVQLIPHRPRRHAHEVRPHLLGPRIRTHRPRPHQVQFTVTDEPRPGQAEDDRQPVLGPGPEPRYPPHLRCHQPTREGEPVWSWT